MSPVFCDDDDDDVDRDGRFPHHLLTCEDLL